MFQPAIPLPGYGGWQFLQSTYSRQLETFSDSAQISSDRAYLSEKLSQPISVEDFLDDRRLLRIALTANDLAGEEWKRGFIDKVLSEVQDPESTFLARLNSPQYSTFATTFLPGDDGLILLSPDDVISLADQYEQAAFQLAVGEVDNNMRLSLNYQSRIVDLAGAGGTDESILFRILGDVPVRTVLESALNLPTEMRSLPIERQAEMLQDRLLRTFGVRELSDLTSPDKIDDVLERFHTMESVRQGPSATAPGSTALAILGGSFGFGGGASQNLFLSLLR